MGPCVEIEDDETHEKFIFIPINDKKRREIMESETFDERAKKTKKFSRKETFSIKVVAETGIGFNANHECAAAQPAQARFWP